MTDQARSDYPNSGKAFEVETPKFEGQFLSGSDFNTDCPHCGKRTNWFLDVYKKASSKGGWWYIIKVKAKRGPSQGQAPAERRSQGTQGYQSSMPLETKKPQAKYVEKPIDDDTIPF